MSTAELPLNQLCEHAVKAATAAGRYIRSVDREQVQAQYKAAGSSAASQLVTEVDYHCEAIIFQHLEESCAQWNIAFVGEESAGHATEDRLSKPYFWCIDPLDGTLPFVEGRPGYAVSIALVAQSGDPLIGVVYDPHTQTLIHAINGQGVVRDNTTVFAQRAEVSRLRVLADMSFAQHREFAALESIIDACSRRMQLDGFDLVYGNGAVKNACQVLEFPAACYFKLPKTEEGGGSIWDFAATACIAKEAGAWVSDIHGQTLDLNRRDSSFMNHQGVMFASCDAIACFLIAALAR